jgi:hypothetical protein
MFERTKTFHALDCAAAVIGPLRDNYVKIVMNYNLGRNDIMQHLPTVHYPPPPHLQ